MTNKIAHITEYLGSKYFLTIVQWKDKSAWRVGLDWKNEHDYEFICEKPTLIEALECAYGYANGMK